MKVSLIQASEARKISDKVCITSYIDKEIEKASKRGEWQVDLHKPYLHTDSDLFSNIINEYVSEGYKIEYYINNRSEEPKLVTSINDWDFITIIW